MHSKRDYIMVIFKKQAFCIFKFDHFALYLPPFTGLFTKSLRIYVILLHIY